MPRELTGISSLAVRLTSVAKTARFAAYSLACRLALAGTLASALTVACATESPLRETAAPAICAEVARLANDGALAAAMSRSGGGLLADHGELEVGPAKLEGGGKGEAKIDRTHGLFILGADGSEDEPKYDSTIDWELDDFRWADPLGTLRRNGRNYIVWGEIQGNGLRYLSQVTPLGENKVVCQFWQIGSPKRALVSGKGAMCEATLAGTLDYVPFDKPHSVTTPLARETSAGAKAARVDIDNDGTLDSVVSTSYSSSHGSGCDIEGLAVLNNERTEFAQTDTDDLVERTAEECGDVVKVFTFKDRSYLERQSDRGRGNTSIFELDHGTKLKRCEISVMPVNYVLNGVERLMRAAEQSYTSLWEYAFRDPGFDKAEFLLKGGRSVDDTIGDHSLLGWAIWQERSDVFDWLLEHGANPNFNGTSNTVPLVEAVWYEHYPMAIRLVEVGADPARGLVRVQDNLWHNTEIMAPFILAATKKAGHLPEELLRKALESHAPLLDTFLASGVPIELFQTEWYAGTRSSGSVPFMVARELAGNPADLEKVTRLYQHVRPPLEPYASVYYGTAAHAWEIRRGGSSKLTDEELLTFSTAFCIHFLNANCGPEELVTRSSAWSEQLHLPCDEGLSGKLDETACSVIMYIAMANVNTKYDSAVLIATFEGDSDSGSFITRANLPDLYLSKHASN